MRVLIAQHCANALCCRAGKLEHITRYKEVLHSTATASNKRPVVVTTTSSGCDPPIDILITAPCLTWTPYAVHPSCCHYGSEGTI